MKQFTKVLILLTLIAGNVANAEDEKPEKSKKDPAKLPTFSNGPYQKAFAVYESNLYRAIIDEEGILHVQPLAKNGDAIGKPFVCYRLSCYYRDPDTRHHRGRPVVEFNDPGRPLKQPAEVTFSGKLKDDVDFELVYEFSRNKITAAGACDDPRGIAQPTHFRLLTSFPASHSIPPQMEQRERKKLLEGLVVETKEIIDGRNKKFEYPYYDIMKFSGRLDSLEVKGLYGERVIELDKKRAKGTLRGRIYSNFCPWQGFGVYYTTKLGEMDLRDNELEVTLK